MPNVDTDLITSLINCQNINWQCDLVSDRLDQYLHKNPNRLDQSTLQKIHNLQTKLKHNIFEIAVLGLASCGKTTILNGLQGKKNWITSPLHGTTTDLNTGFNLEAIALKSNSPKVLIRLIDTPGLDEVGGETRAEIAIQAAHQADLILFITAGDLTRQELEIISQLKQAYKPILLVFNKIDLYPQSDRQLIYEALQDQELQALISPNEIIFTSAEPLARRVRFQSIGKSDDKFEEIWEKPSTDIKVLKQKILDLLNQDGKSLLAINAVRSLIEIHRNYIQTDLDRFLSQRTLASGIFILKAIAILISPFPVLGFILSTLIDSSLILGASRFWGYGRLGLGLGLSVISGIILANIPNHYGQIIWLAGATPWLIDWLKQDLQKAYGLQNLIAEVTENCTPGSIFINSTSSFKPKIGKVLFYG